MASSGDAGGHLMDFQSDIDQTHSSHLIPKVENGSKSLLITNMNTINKPSEQQVNAKPTIGKIITISKSEQSNQFVVSGTSQSSVALNNALYKSSVMNPHTVSITNSPHKIVTIPKTPPRQIVAATRLTFSPGKSPTKYTMISGGVKTSVGIIQPGQIVGMVSQAGLTSLPHGATKTIMSPTKVYLQNQSQVNLQPQTVVSSNVQSNTMQGNKLQYVRLVTTPSQSASVQTQHRNLAPAPGPAKSLLPSSDNVGRIPIQPNQHKPVLPSQTQRVILPATNQVPIRPQMTAIAPRPQQMNTVPQSLSSLPPGTTIIQGNQNMSGVQGFALVPAQYLTQVPPPSTQSSMVQKASDSTFQQPRTARSVLHNGPPVVTPSTDNSGQRPRKPCNCTKSQCLKLYCDCFANGEFCNNCNCNNCFNNLDHEEERGRAIKSCLDRNPLAFKPKIGKGKGEATDRRHNKGCNCKRSGCLKNYCECYEAKILCSALCKCVGCKNYEDGSCSDHKNLSIMSASSSEDTKTSLSVVKSKLTTSVLPPATKPAAPSAGERLPYSFVTTEVAEATCMCLVAQAEEGQRNPTPYALQERMILEEFGRCLMQVIESANKTQKSSQLL